MSHIVITGAASYLGAFALRHLRATTGHDIVAVASDRPGASRPAIDGVRWLSANLTQTPGAELRAALAEAHRVLHFAWTRTSDEARAWDANRRMLEALTTGMPDPSRFWFVSSVSASPGAHSSYGRTKHRATRYVAERGGSVLVCGLVVEQHPTQGPYLMLRNVIAKQPMAVRAIGRQPLVFPIRISDLGSYLATISTSDPGPGIYQMFSQPLPFNRFIALIEALYPRTRVPLPFSASLAIGAASLGKRLGLLPEKICDQVMTFLYKDADYLLQHPRLASVQPMACEDPRFFSDA